MHLQPVKIGVSFKQEAFSIREGVDRDEVGEGDDSQDGVECSQCGVVWSWYSLEAAHPLHD